MSLLTLFRTPHSTLRTPFNPWPSSIIAFFTVVILGCAGFIAFCSRHPADLVASDYYDQEIRYQGQIDRIQNTQQHAQPASVRHDPITRRITISLPPGGSATNTSGTIHLYRPSSANLDRQINLDLNPSGIQTLDAGPLLPGLWKVRVSWTANNQDYFLDQEIVIPSIH